MARVILRKEVENLGEVGDVVEVKDGYALNYLIPRGLALHATASSVKATQHEQRIREAQVQAARRTAQEAAGKFQGVEVEIFEGRLLASGHVRWIKLEDGSVRVGIQFREGERAIIQQVKEWKGRIN